MNLIEFKQKNAGVSVKPILFSTEMVQAILQGRKTQTRRVIKEEKLLNILRNHICPYGHVGDILWVRETWIPAPSQVTWKTYSYKADYKSTLADLGKWKPSIHMPFEAARIFLRIKSVRVERLQAIGEEDSKAEGVESLSIDSMMFYKNYLDSSIIPFDNAHLSFLTLWESINGPDSWDANPWVWVVEFERISKYGEIENLPFALNDKVIVKHNNKQGLIVGINQSMNDYQIEFSDGSCHWFFKSEITKIK